VRRLAFTLGGPLRSRDSYEQRLCQSSSLGQFLSVFRDLSASAGGTATEEKSPCLTVSLGKLPGNVSDHEKRAENRVKRGCTTLRASA
jgi:hypothetical protein